VNSPTTPHSPVQPETACLFEDWFDPIESGLRDFIEEMIRSELDAVLARPRYARQRTGAPEANPVGRQSTLRVRRQPDLRAVASG
jgi:hypothetical protein